MTDAPTTKIEKRFNLGCLILGIAVTLGPILYFVILAFVDNPVGFVPPTFSSKDVTPESLAFGPDGTLLALADREGNVAVWNIRTGKAEFQVKRQVERMEEPPLLAFSGEGGFLGAGFNDGEVAVWSLIDSSIKWAAREHDAGIVHIKWHGTEPVVSACDSSTGQITWDAGAGKVIMAFPDAAKIMNLDRLKQSTAGMPPHVGTFIEVTGPNEVSVVRYRSPQSLIAFRANRILFNSFTFPTQKRCDAAISRTTVDNRRTLRDRRGKKIAQRCVRGCYTSLIPRADALNLKSPSVAPTITCRSFPSR